MLVIGRDISAINPLTGGFKGGLRTSLGSFSISKPYKTVNNIEEINETEEEEDDNDESNDSISDSRYRYEPVLTNYYKRSSKTPNKKSNLMLSTFNLGKIYVKDINVYRYVNE